jgi:DNA-binding NtrC family response regulator
MALAEESLLVFDPGALLGPGIWHASAPRATPTTWWPGNIRELQNVIERSLIVCETDEFTIDKSWLSSESMPPVPEIRRQL